MVPITEWKPRYASYPWFVRLTPTPTNGLTKESGADAFQVKSVATERLHTRLGELSSAELEAVVRAVGRVIGHP